jgi:hypothetical protein
MPKLFGAQRLVLQAIQDAQGETSAFIEDARVAEATQIEMRDMRDWFLTLDQDGYVDLALTEGGMKASVTPQGRLALRLVTPPHPRASTEAPSSPAISVRPANALAILIESEGRPVIRLPEFCVQVEEVISECSRTGIWPKSRINMGQRAAPQAELDDILARSDFPEQVRRRFSAIRMELKRIAETEDRMGRGIDILLLHGSPRDLIRAEDRFLSILGLIRLFTQRTEVRASDTKIDVWEESCDLDTSVELGESELSQLLYGMPLDALLVPWKCSEVPVGLLRDKFLPAMVHAIVSTDVDLDPALDLNVMCDFLSWQYGLG